MQNKELDLLFTALTKALKGLSKEVNGEMRQSVLKKALSDLTQAIEPLKG